MNKEAQEAENQLRGMPVSSGIAIGPPVLFFSHEERVPTYDLLEGDLEAEVQRYRLALRGCRNEIEGILQQLRLEGVMDAVAILETHIQMLKDPLLSSNIEQEICSRRINMEAVFDGVVDELKRRFGKIADPFFQERLQDFLDVTQRIRSQFSPGSRVQDLSNLPSSSIVFTSTLSPSDAAEAHRSQVLAFVTSAGGCTSHAAIVAKAKRIPFVAHVEFDEQVLQKTSLVIVDGRTGTVLLDPSEEVVSHYTELQRQIEDQFEALAEGSSLATETFDGYQVGLSGNLDMVSDLEALHKYGGSGVGLFRSEYIFLSNERFPSEDEQFEIYRDLMEKMQGLPVVIRTFDIGGDKLTSEASRASPHPHLGCRAIRLMLKEQEHFKTQLRAILRATVYGKLDVMFPMVSGLPELREAKALVEEARRELVEEGTPLGDSLRIGCMIEVPSAAIVSDLLARECDFLSIGTNDLVQYSLAIDRLSQDQSPIYSPTHPSVLRMIKMVVTEASRHGIPVSVCGEIAADPKFTPLLLGLGVRDFSVAPSTIPIVKNTIRRTSIVEANRLAELALSMATALEIHDLLEDAVVV